MSVTTPRWHELADHVLAGGAVTAADALAVLDSPDSELMEVVAAASRLRFEHFGNKVKVNYLVNLKSGLCPEDCFYCSQRLNSTAGILRYTWLNTDEAVTAARRQATELYGSESVPQAKRVYKAKSDAAQEITQLAAQLVQGAQRLVDHALQSRHTVLIPSSGARSAGRSCSGRSWPRTAGGR